jgi:hypothetical protein
MSLRVYYEVLNQKGSPALFTDTFANRPAFGFQGRLFMSTDTAQIFEDTGSAWTLIADATGSVSGFVPYTGATTDVNLGSFDLTADLGILNQVKAVGSGGLSINANSGTQIALLGAGGGANMTIFGALSGTTGSFLNSSASTGLNVASDNVIFRANTGVSTPRQIELSMSGATSTFLDAKGFGANYITDFGIRTYNSIGTAFNVFYGTSAGNVIIGGTTDAGFRLDCVGTARVSGNLTTSLTTFGSVAQAFTFGGEAVYGTAGSLGTIFLQGGLVKLGNSQNVLVSGIPNGTSAYVINSQGTHSSNSATLQSDLLITPTINFTASGFTLRGIYYNPTITALFGNTHRAIETTTGDVCLGTTSGNVLIGTATTGASKLRIVGLPTSAVGLSSGDIYSNLGILTIVP